MENIPTPLALHTIRIGTWFIEEDPGRNWQAPKMVKRKGGKRKMFATLFGTDASDAIAPTGHSWKHDFSKAIDVTRATGRTMSLSISMQNILFEMIDRLCTAAVVRGFIMPDTKLKIRPDQTPLVKWNLDLRGPSGGQADFLLAVTAPRVPGISPIPVSQSVDGPLFAVVLMPTYIGVFSGREYYELKSITAERDTLQRFNAFLDTLQFASGEAA